MRILHFCLVVALLSVATHPTSAAAQGDLARERVEAMAKRLAGAQRISVAIDCAYDVVQDSGEKIEFGERRELTLDRPNRARFEVTGRDGSHRGVVFDGTRLTAFDFKEKVYATAERPGTVDEAMAYYTEELEMRLPLRELFAADLVEQLDGALDGATLVAEETIRSVATSHVALRRDNADVQLWIAREGEPLPQRIVVTYRLVDGRPQFRADFGSWNFDPEISDSVFTFAPAADMEKIPFLASKAAGSGKQP